MRVSQILFVETMKNTTLDKVVRGIVIGTAFVGAYFINPKYEVLDEKASVKIEWARPAYANEASQRYVKSGEEKYAKGDYDGALADFNDAIKSDPKDGEAYNNAAAALKHKKELDNAVRYIEQSIKIEENDVKYRNLALIYYDMGRKEDAISAFKKAIELNPNDTKSKGWIEYLER
jgi:tetratricopeptide (TPR) repeat protein